MKLCIIIPELRKALAELERCEKNGFPASLGVFRLSMAGDMLRDCRMSFDHTWDRVEENPARDYGTQGTAKNFRYIQGEGLVPIKPPSSTEVKQPINNPVG